MVGNRRIAAAGKPIARSHTSLPLVQVNADHGCPCQNCKLMRVPSPAALTHSLWTLVNSAQSAFACFSNFFRDIPRSI